MERLRDAIAWLVEAVPGRRFEAWFADRFGWFFTNGMKRAKGSTKR